MAEVRQAEIELLIQALADGHEDTMEALYEKTGRYVFGLLVRILGSRSQAEEVAQEVYVQIWRSAQKFDPGRGSGLAWIGMIARSRALDRVRSTESYGQAMVRLERQPAAHPLGRDDDPAAAAVASERRVLVTRALDSLPEEQRTALERAFFMGESHREISDRTGIPLGTVKSRIRAALGKLETALEPVLGNRRISDEGAR